MKLSVMPVYNEAATLAEAVKAVLEAVYPREMGLVVVDDGSTDTTPQILAGLRDERMARYRPQGDSRAADDLPGDPR